MFTEYVAKQMKWHVLEGCNLQKIPVGNWIWKIPNVGENRESNFSPAKQKSSTTFKGASLHSYIGLDCQLWLKLFLDISPHTCYNVGSSKNVINIFKTAFSGHLEMDVEFWRLQINPGGVWQQTLLVMFSLSSVYSLNQLIHQFSLPHFPVEDDYAV